MKLDLVTRSPGFAAGAYGPIAVSIWEESPTREHAQVASAVLTSVARLHKEMLVLAVVGPQCPPPDAAVREVLATDLRRLAKQVQGVANLVEGEGFRAAALRSVLTGMALLIRPPYPQRICASLTEAVDFLVGQSDGRVSAHGLTAAVNELRRS